MYTTTSNIREECGFAYNFDISDAVIKKYQTKAYALIRAYVGSKYDLSCFSTNFVGSDAELLLEVIECSLASGMLYNKEYQGEETEDSGDGNTKIDFAREQLSLITSGEIKLFDANGNEFCLKTANSSAGTAGLVTMNRGCDVFTGNEKW